jgi:hypothetical protein
MRREVGHHIIPKNARRCSTLNKRRPALRAEIVRAIRRLLGRKCRPLGERL